jgi:MFS family permease
VVIPGIAGLVAAAILIGIGVGLITPIGFAYLATTTPTERLGQTLGSAEVGRELGDAGGPLLVGGLAAAATLTPALLTFAALLTATAAIVAIPPGWSSIKPVEVRTNRRELQQRDDGEGTAR